MATDLLKLGSQPISIESPTGVSILYDPIFEQLEAEIRKLDSLHGEKVDWDKVLDLASAILAAKSKDLWVTGYLCLALLHKEGYVGLSRGLALYRDLITGFWDSLYPEPKRMRRRANAVSWLSERVGVAVTRRKPGAEEKEAVHLCGDLVEQLRDLIDTKFGPDSPGLTDLRSAIREQVAAVGPLKPAASEVKQGTVARQEASSASLISDPIAIASAEDAERAINGAKDLIRRAIDFLQEADLTNPLPYRMARLICWMGVKELPSSRNGRTEMAGIAPDLSKRFEESLDRGDWLTVLNEAETKFRETVFWLDAHRFVVRAMAGLGSSYEEAQKAVREELAAFLFRLPGLLDLQFRNGVPFADSRTRLWIESEVLPAFIASVGGSLTASAAGQAQPDQSPMDEAVRQAKRLIATGKLQEAVALFQKGLNSTSVRRERFLWKLHLAKSCLEAGRPQLAVPQLEFLDEEVHRFSLEEWEPALTLEVVQTLLSCQHKLIEDSRQPAPEVTERANKLYARLCRLDALLALALDGKK